MMNKFSIATITWARDDGEEQLLRRSLQQLAKLDIPVFITDGGSNKDFVQFMQAFPQFNVTEAKIPGLWAQVKISLLKAYKSGSQFVFYTEPDKHDFFSKKLITMLGQLKVDKQTGIITASRSAIGLKVFRRFSK